MTTPPCVSSWPAANSRNCAAYRGNSRAEIHSALNEFSLPFAPPSLGCHTTLQLQPWLFAVLIQVLPLGLL